MAIQRPRYHLRPEAREVASIEQDEYLSPQVEHVDVRKCRAELILLTRSALALRE